LGSCINSFLSTAEVKLTDFFLLACQMALAVTTLPLTRYSEIELFTFNPRGDKSLIFPPTLCALSQPDPLRSEKFEVVLVLTAVIDDPVAAWFLSRDHLVTLLPSPSHGFPFPLTEQDIL